jgi:hypothetical protein
MPILKFNNLIFYPLFSRPNAAAPACQYPICVMNLIPKEISSGIIVIHYSPDDEIDSDIESDGVPKVKDNSKPDIVQISSEKDQKISMQMQKVNFLLQ